MFHCKQSIEVAEAKTIQKIDRDTKLINHYLIKHPATLVVTGIGLVLLLIMMASLPKQTSKIALTPKIHEKQEMPKRLNVAMPDFLAELNSKHFTTNSLTQKYSYGTSSSIQ